MHAKSFPPPWVKALMCWNPLRTARLWKIDSWYTAMLSYLYPIIPPLSIEAENLLVWYARLSWQLVRFSPNFFSSTGGSGLKCPTQSIADREWSLRAPEIIKCVQFFKRYLEQRVCWTGRSPKWICLTITFLSLTRMRVTAKTSQRWTSRRRLDGADCWHLCHKNRIGSWLPTVKVSVFTISQPYRVS